VDSPIELPYEGSPSADIPLDYDDLDEMHAAIAEAAAQTEESARFLVEVGFDRYLVELAAGEARARKLVFVGPHAALVAHLCRGDYPRAPSPPRDPTSKYALALYWPSSMLQMLQDEAVRCDESMSAIVKFAWRTSYAKVHAADADTIARARQRSEGDVRRQTLYYPGGMLDQIEAEAARLDVSQSSVVQAAVWFARGEITKLPSA
jgi:uncharacterized small protein (TIGR04563 family)